MAGHQLPTDSLRNSHKFFIQIYPPIRSFIAGFIKMSFDIFQSPSHGLQCNLTCRWNMSRDWTSEPIEKTHHPEGYIRQHWTGSRRGNNRERDCGVPRWSKKAEKVPSATYIFPHYFICPLWSLCIYSSYFKWSETKTPTITGYFIDNAGGPCTSVS